MSASSLPLAGVVAFLHIRDGFDGDHRDARAVKRDVRRLVQQLGATLSISEAAADLIIFHCGSASFLQNMEACGKCVVGPEYLYACRRAERRVDATLHKVLASGEKCTRSSSAKANPRLEVLLEEEEEERQSEMQSSTQQMTTGVASASNALVFIEAEAEADGEVVVVGDTTNSVSTPKLSPSALGPATPPQGGIWVGRSSDAASANKPSRVKSSDSEMARSVAEEIIRHEVLRTTASSAPTRRRGRHGQQRIDNEKAATKVDPFLLPSNSASELMVESAESSGSSTPLVTPQLLTPSRTTAETAMRRQPVTDEGISSDTAPATRKRGRTAVSEKNPQNRGRRLGKSIAKKDAPPAAAVADPVLVGADAVPLAMQFTTDIHLQPCSIPPSKLRIGFLLSEPQSTNDSLLAFLSDVVLQLGGTVLPDSTTWCRRRRDAKPTHLIMRPEALLTTEALVVKAYGVHVITPQWLYDAIACGTFVEVVPAIHAHRLYGDAVSRPGAFFESRNGEDVLVDQLAPAGDQMGVLGEVEESHPSPRSSSRGGTAKRSSAAALCFLRRGVMEEQIPAGQQWERPYYRPILQNLMFYLYVPPDGEWRGPASAHRVSGVATTVLEQVAELIRILGGTVTRNIESDFLDVVIDLLEFAEVTAQVAATAATALQEKNEESPSNHDKRPVDLHESLSLAYQSALHCISESLQPQHSISAAALSHHKVRRGGVQQPSSSTSSAATRATPPIVGAPWLIYTVISRQLTDVTPFLRQSHPLQLSLAKAAAALSGGAALNESTIQPHPHNTTRDAAAAIFADAAVAPGRKLKAGPRTSRKEAAAQLDTQQIELVLHQNVPQESMELQRDTRPE